MIRSQRGGLWLCISRSQTLRGNKPNCPTLTPPPGHRPPQYKRLYESRVEAYLKKAGVPLPVFVAACEDLARSDESYEILVSTLAALDDFQLFCDMMRAKAPSP